MLAVTVNRELLTRYQNVLTPTTVIGIVLTIGIAGWLVLRLRAWFREGDGRADDHLEMLTQFRDLRQQGELTEDEYRLIKDRLIHPSSPRPSATTTPATIATTRERADDTGDTGKNSTLDAESRFGDESSNVRLEGSDLAETGMSGRNPDEQPPG